MQVIAAKEAGSAAPVRSIDGNTFLYIRHKDMFFVAVSRSNANAGMYDAAALLSIDCGVAAVHVFGMTPCFMSCIWRFDPVVAALVFAFLYAMVDIFKGYFEEDFDEDSLRDNFTLVYELLDGTCVPSYCTCFRNAANRRTRHQMHHTPFANPVCLLLCRDLGLWVPPEQQLGCAEDVHQFG